ncbi:peptide-methionine (S)-S-oxide reductase MsrA [Fluviispira multicolorata]|uniref:Peptide methionine sulfoxide reductase MsrA n=1 Tax=Fluviispira multicolorata TaxID=2654512 RepID=A0A833JFQ0_9BACT|nr:peptide-methionine (S)-S-oxide reductase MsrA [Fluviispira multicolorata]KAB8031074.1 peptide-methionine (S)-S-oxide reductase MsrA [Fluviispira multicolorata]
MLRLLLLLFSIIPHLIFSLENNKNSLTTKANGGTEIAIVAGGCFWCVQADFDKLEGVTKTVVGYDGDNDKTTTYEKVSSGKTQFVESTKIFFNPQKISYSEILNYFWKHVDPTNNEGQFCDKGKQYRTVIFYLNESQKKLAIQSKEKIKEKFNNVATDVIPSTNFVTAEEYHQNYYKKNPIRYTYYRKSCGRDARVKEVWNEKSN